MDYQTIANSPAMWAVCSLIVLVVCFQATLFIYKAKQAAQSVGISNEQIKVAVRTAMISSIGPSLGVAIAMLSLMLSLGTAFAWMRLSVIGSVPFELFAASSAAKAAGTEIGSDSFNIHAYVNVVWTCTISALGWLVIVMCFGHKFDTMRTTLVRGREEMLPALSLGAMIGAISYFSAPQLLKNLPHFSAFAVSGITVLLLSMLANKSSKAWLHDWAFGFAIFAGMASTLLFA
ncbi:DUF5058 family protein [Vibrio metoecus]|uniref:DUF5058 family protein n=1 Tax=Vibrio metoecus TaxID=1481663 RepID=UPI00215BBC1B|nr:DUF5058 family protein [Vibrio metoecus]MCR9387277.1 DUF5058 family protein [Vibrio metoecus]